MPRISLIVCSYNRSEILPRCLRAAVAQTLAARDYEVILVDNGSTDNTQAIAAAWPGVRYLYFGFAGLSQARNAGAHAARSPLIAFIDDDAIAAPDLLESYLDSFEAHPDAGCCGGRIDLTLPPRMPAWYSKQYAGYFSAFDLGYAELRRVTELWEFPFGANVAYRREALERAGYFNLRLGRVGKGAAGGEELDLECRIAQLGYAVYYQPRAAVEHVILPERVRWAHIAKSARAAGRNWAYYEVELLKTGWSIRGDLGLLGGAIARLRRRESKYFAYSQCLFYSAKIFRKLRYAIEPA